MPVAAGYIWTVHNGEDNSIEWIFYFDTDELILQSVGGTGDVFKTTLTLPALDTWEQIGWSWDGGVLSAGITLYVAGTPAAVEREADATVLPDMDGTWSLGGRIYDDNRNLNAGLAEVGWWNRQLNAGEWAALARGQSPLGLQNGLVFYPPLIRSPNDWVAGRTGTLDGTSVVTHPPAIKGRAMVHVGRTIAGAPPAGNVPQKWFHYSHH